MFELLPPPSSASVREWFAGLALANERLMSGLGPAERVKEAVRIADELVKALSISKLPSQRTMRAPTKEELKFWEEKIQRQTRPTRPVARKTVKLTLRASPAPPANLPPVMRTSAGCYSIVNDREEK